MRSELETSDEIANLFVGHGVQSPLIESPFIQSNSRDADPHYGMRTKAIC